MQYRVNTELCTGCGECADICPTEAIRVVNGKAAITIDCIDCGACPRVCSEGAISKISKQTLPAPAPSA